MPMRIDQALGSVAGPVLGWAGGAANDNMKAQISSLRPFVFQLGLSGASDGPVGDRALHREQNSGVSPQA